MNDPRESILACACELYLTDGLAGLSMRKLAKEVGVTAPALYRYYDGREAVLADLVREAHRVFLSEHSIGSYRWSPDGTAVAFTATLPTPADRAEARAAGFRQTVYDEDWDPIGLFVWDHDTGEVKQFEIPGSVFGMDWSPDGSSMVLAIAPRPLR